eukprot:5754575-Amphidinium_carterae.2
MGSDTPHERFHPRYMFVMMSSHSMIGVAQSFFSKSDVEMDDPMMAMMGTMGGAGMNPMMPGGGPDMSKIYKQDWLGL